MPSFLLTAYEQDSRRGLSFPECPLLGVISVCMSSSGTEVDTEVTPHLGQSAFTRLSVCLYYFTSSLSSHPEEVDPASPCWPQTPSSPEAGLMRNMRGEISIQTPSYMSGIQAACPRPLAMRPCCGVEESLISCSEVRVFAISTVGDPQSGLLHHLHHTEGPSSLFLGGGSPRAPQGPG